MTLQGFGNCIHSMGGVVVGPALKLITAACWRKTTRPGLASVLVGYIDHLLSILAHLFWYFHILDDFRYERANSEFDF
jgi:hypothetical protein